MEQEAQREMPRFRSHKVVHALRLAEVNPGRSVTPADRSYPKFAPHPAWWDRCQAEEQNDPGVYVVYADGYASWSPTRAFDEGYTEIHDDPRPSFELGSTFGWALAMLRRGLCVARSGWNGEGMFLYLVPGSTFAVNRPPLLGIYSEGTVVDYRPHIDMRTADGSCVPWLASQTDLLADDWVLVPPV